MHISSNTYYLKAIFLSLFLAVGLTIPTYSSTDPTTEEDPYMIKEFPIEGSGILKVSTPNGDISVQRMPYIEKVIVELYVDRGYSLWSGSKNLDNYRIIITQRGKEIIASVEPKNGDKGLFKEQVKFSYKIYVPQNMSTELKATGGNIIVSGLKGDHTFKNSGGDIIASDIEGKITSYTSGGNINVTFAKGTIFAWSEGGNVTVEKSQGEMRFKVNGGSIVASKVSGSMLAHAAGGAIVADFESISKGVNLSSSFGSINLTIPEKLGYTLDLKGDGIYFPNTPSFSGTSNSNRVLGTVDGGGTPINIISDAGSITVSLENKD